MRAKNLLEKYKNAAIRRRDYVWSEQQLNGLGGVQQFHDKYTEFVDELQQKNNLKRVSCSAFTKVISTAASTWRFFVSCGRRDTAPDGLRILKKYA